MIIYKITNKLNGKIYIGQTVRTLEERIEEYKRKRRTAIERAIQKYGIENFNFEVIDTAETPEELNEKEIKWIKHFNCIHPNGYNLCEGGGNTKGYKHKEESKKKMSKSKKGRFIGENNPFFGKTHSEETRKRWSEQRKGRVLSDEWRKKLSENNAFKRKVINLDTKEIFDSVKAAADKYNVPSSNISRCCKGKRPTSAGYRWMYLDEYEKQNDSLQLKPLDEFLQEVKKNQLKFAGSNKRKVINLDTKEVFDSLIEAARKNNLKSCTSIIQAIKKGTKANGYRWAYYE
ncbi:NUMOD3 domain-containing DNA-binding protein [Geobacillus stearothermophilus]|uniref:GIY-YIG domain-containing protein n=1 Tax=Geobacillus stearothermophilus TaxID=1422 RepID=A0A150MUV4_GEOSE|nr:NUMOD3 domain-containing DNA-binding protein [Geobacillus stearothermophilus]KYD28159.1 hypothetical protein B4109_3060 [Geobacillus stearothermophilus]